MPQRNGQFAPNTRSWSTSARRPLITSAIAIGGVTWPMTTAITMSTPKWMRSI